VHRDIFQRRRRAAESAAQDGSKTLLVLVVLVHKGEPTRLSIALQRTFTAYGKGGAMPRKLKGPTEKQLDTAFKPLAIEIGKLTRSWNMLHEHLAQIFARIVNPENVIIPLAIWYSTSSDRSQREMLRAAAASFGAINTKNHPTAKDDIEWLLNQCNSLSDQRNDALHAPLAITSDSTKKIEVISHYFLGNPRARKLKDKNLFDQIRWYRDKTEVLKNYALAIWFHLGQHRSWPQRPLMPTLGQSPTHKK
jgi:hypothetical protein